MRVWGVWVCVASGILGGCLQFEPADHLDGYCFNETTQRYELCIAVPDSGPDAGANTGVPDSGDTGVPDSATGDAQAEDQGGLDAGVDGGRDAESEAGVDGGPDATPDGGPDAGGDAGADSGPDAGADGGPDGGPDAGPDAGTVTVSLQPTGPGTLVVSSHGQSCAGPCSFSVVAGTSLQVEATPNAFAELSLWSQPAACLSAGSSCALTVGTTDLTVAAEFVWLQRNLSVSIAGASTGTGQVVAAGISCPGTCSGQYDHGTPVSLDAQPGPGTRFLRWLGDCSGSNPTCALTMDAAKVVQAQFEAVPPLVSNGQAADLVLGQPDFTSSQVQPLSGSSLSFPLDCASDGTHLVVSDTLNRRVLQWFSPPVLSNQAADNVLGQSNFISSAALAASASSIQDPAGLEVSQGRLFVADQSRVLLWDSLPSSINSPANRLLGQADFTTNLSPSGATAARFGPAGLAASSLAVWVADDARHRVLGFASTTAGTGLVPAQRVLGQANFVSGARARPPTTSSFATPYAIAIDSVSGRVAVADALNHRVMVWNSLPTIDNQPADLILGQPSATARSENAGLPTVNAVGMSTPRGVHFSQDSLFVSDFGNQRVLVWSPIPTQIGSPATAVIGAPDMVTAPSGAASATRLVGPQGLCQAGASVFVVDSGANRLLRFALTRP